MISAINTGRIRLAKNDEGIALILVMGVSMVLVLLVTVVLGVALSGMTKSKTDESLNAAMAAAYAGVEDYKSKIANDPTYYRYGNPTANFSKLSSVVAPPIPNPAFAITAGGTWASVPDDSPLVADKAYYRYEVDTRSYSVSGIIKVRSTGRVAGVTRTVVASLKQKGFIDFLYYTDYEISDPGLLTDQTLDEQAQCSRYAYETPARPSWCVNLTFSKFDTINGPMHTNDAFKACGATFNGAVTTAYAPPPGQDAYDKSSCTTSSGGPALFPKGKPVTVKSLPLPLSNQKMFNEVRTDIPADVPNPGCLYTGPTKITFTDDGKMTVRSPWTKVTRVSNEAGTVGTNNAACGLPGTGANQLGSALGATVTVPPRNLILVQDVEFVSTNVDATMPQWKTGTYPIRTGTTAYTATECNAGNFLGYPIANESVVNGITTAYNCKKGDVFVEGTVNAEATIGADNFIYITGDIKYSTTSATESVLGLVAQNQIWVWNPVKNYVNKPKPTPDTADRMFDGDRRIDAAMLSVLKTFQVQNFDLGTGRGVLTVTGAIAQKYRGPVAQQSGVTLVSGFKKNYNYDERLRYIAPPKFLSPVATSYEVAAIVEVRTAFKPDGSPIAEPTP